MGTVDDFLAGLDAADRSVYERLRDLAVTEVPEAAQGTSYGMPALTYRGKPLLGFRTARNHLSLFPFSAEAVEAVRDTLAGFELSKGTVRFDAARPLPDDAVRTLVRARADEIDASGRPR